MLESDHQLITERSAMNPHNDQQAEKSALDEPVPISSQEASHAVDERQRQRFWLRQRFILAVLVLFTGFFGAHMIEDTMDKFHFYNANLSAEQRTNGVGHGIDNPHFLRGIRQTLSANGFTYNNLIFSLRAGRTISAFGTCHLTAVVVSTIFWPKLRPDGTDNTKHHWMPKRIVPLSTKDRRGYMLTLLSWYAFFGDEFRMFVKTTLACYSYLGGKEDGSLAQAALWTISTLAAYLTIAVAAWEVAPVMPF